MSETKTFLLEIGTEEVPASYILPALEQMDALFQSFCEEKRLTYKNIKTFGTPRRMAILAEGVPTRQASAKIEKKGPAVKSGMDADGNFTAPAINFARSQGMEPDQLLRIDTPKGEYFFAVREDAGSPADKILSEYIRKAIQTLTFPKNMRWADVPIKFARPIRWICSLFGDQTVESGIEEVKNGSSSIGHRYYGNKAVEVGDADNYESALKAGNVAADWQARSRLIVDELKKASDGEPVINASTLEEVNFLIEYPYIGKGSFDKQFLELPEELLLLCIEKTQRYFPVRDASGKLKNEFLVAMNAPVTESAIVRASYEKVLLSRLKDASFFWGQDLKKSLTEWADKLSHIQFQAKLGTLQDKIDRIHKMGAQLAGKLGWTAEEAKALDLAVALCKADLSTNMVIEFPSLQGIMGKHYARRDENIPAEVREAVALAIGEHYMPLSAEGTLPKTKIGAALSAMDKLDTLLGYFSLGKIPSGAGDPFSLRRQGSGITRIISQFERPMPLKEILEMAIAVWPDETIAPKDRAKLAQDAFEFLAGRIRQQLDGEGLRYDTINALIFDDAAVAPEVFLKARAIEKLRDEADFLAMLEGATRMENILKKSAGKDRRELKQPDPAKFEQDEEKVLHAAAKELEARFESARSHEEMIRGLFKLTEPITKFFDDVMVMADNEAVRENRLALLGQTLALYRRLGDFSQIVKTA